MHILRPCLARALPPGARVFRRAAAGISLSLVLLVRAAEVVPDPAREIAELRRQITYHDDLYHKQAAPEIADHDYDRLKRRLAELERRFPHAARSSPPLAAVADDRSGLFPAHRHRTPMLSLDKAYTEADLRAFHERVTRSIGRTDTGYVIEPKLDGLAISVTFAAGRLVRAATRGNGTEGDDVTANALQIAGLPRNLRGRDPPALIEVRGEVYLPFAEFARVNAEREAAGEAPFAHPRNVAAGTLRQLDPREVARRGLHIAFFGVGACDPPTALPANQRALIARLKAWGLPVAEPAWTADGVEELVAAVETSRRARPDFGFPTDGVVVKLASIRMQQELGDSEHSPRWAIAFKFPPDRRETEVLAITIQVGRTGVLTPVAELDPVSLSGSTVSRATLHNRNEIARKDVRVGDYVYVEKAGDIIPAITGVNLKRRPASATPFAFPNECPRCATPATINDRAAAVRCPNAACPAQLARRVEHFASRECVDIDGLGPVLIAELVDRGLVRDVPDIYRLRREDLRLPGTQPGKFADQLLAAIESSRRAELWRFIYGLGLPRVGATRARELARQHGTLEAFAAAEPRGRELARALLQAGVRPSLTATASTLAGQSFVLTGTLPTLTRPQATTLIEAAGGKVRSSVSRATNYVVAGNDAGAKRDQAAKLGVPIIDERELRRMMGNGAVEKN